LANGYSISLGLMLAGTVPMSGARRQAEVFKRFINFMLLANGITPAGHKEQDKWAKIREDRERWEREQAEKRALEDGDEAHSSPAEDERRAG